MLPPLRVVLAAVVTAAPLAAQTPIDTPVGVVRAFHQALAAADSTKALSLLAPDVVIFEAGGVEASRDEYESHHLGADMRFAMATKRVITDQKTGNSGDVAWVLTESTTTGTFRDREVNSRGTETMILRRNSSGWRIIHIHWSSRRAH